MRKEIICFALINCLVSVNNVLSNFLYPIVAKEMGLSSAITGILISIYLLAGFIACFSTTFFINYFGRERAFYLTINLMVGVLFVY